MNIVQERLQTMLSAGVTQGQIARELQISVASVNNAVHAKRKPHRRILKLLGLRPVPTVTWVPADDKPFVNPLVPVTGVTWGTPPKRGRGRPRKVAPDALGTPVTPMAAPEAPTVAVGAPDALAPLPEGPTLTVERIRVAQHYGLAPGSSWRQFLGEWSTVVPADIAWASWCSNHSQRPAKQQAEAPAIDRPDGLYKHLQPVDRGQDFTGAASAIGVAGRLAVGGVSVGGGAVSSGVTTLEAKG